MIFTPSYSIAALAVASTLGRALYDLATMRAMASSVSGSIAERIIDRQSLWPQPIAPREDVKKRGVGLAPNG